jgi:hypothetical protein
MVAPFTWATGTNGFTTAPFSLVTTELNSLTNTSTVISSVNGTSGVFTQSNTGGAIFAQNVSLIAGGAFTPTAGGYIQGWFILKGDDTNYERIVTNTALPRPPDFVIPLHVSAYAANDLQGSIGIVRWPAISFKVLTQNMSGVTLPSSGNIIKAGSIEMQY